jgi:hypothetical protein
MLDLAAQRRLGKVGVGLGVPRDGSHEAFRHLVEPLGVMRAVG